MKSLILVGAITVFAMACSALADEVPPTSDVEKRTELILRLGNESNPVDGVFGPFTYGVQGSHHFENEFGIEAGYIRLHEPETAAFISVLDEAQLILTSPERHSFVFGLTDWKNRMIDMYTHLGGLEVTRKGSLSLMAGAYVGTATREEASGNFRGIQLGASSQVGSFEFTGACLLGKIDKGSYRKCGLEGTTDFLEKKAVPLTVTFSIEERYFNFGSDGPVSEPSDEFIFVTGLEIHFENIIFYP